MAKYTYTRSSSVYCLDKELKASPLAEKYDHVEVSGESISVFTREDLLLSEVDVLSVLISNHNPNCTGVAVEKSIANAADIGYEIIKKQAVRNVLLGKTDEQIDSLFDNDDIIKVGMALRSGALAYAKRKVQLIEPFLGFTQEDKDWLLNELP